MTEAQWLACDDPRLMWEHLRGKASDRALRLFLVACCERIEHLLQDARSRSALACARRAADGRADDAELAYEARGARAAWSSALRAVGVQRFGAEAFERMTRTLSTGPGFDAELARSDPTILAADAVQYAVIPSLSEHAIWGALNAAGAIGLAASNTETQQREWAVQCGLLRDIFGNPFRPVTLDPEWRTSTVTALARQMYEARDFSVMPILADALQDAGCDNEEVLNHCRGTGPHVRGCWVVDAVLNKE